MKKITCFSSALIMTSLFLIPNLIMSVSAEDTPGMPPTAAAPGMPPTAVAPGMPPTTAAQAKDPECARFTGKAYRKRCGGGRTKGCIPPFRCFAKGHTPPTNLPARLHR